MSDTHLTVGSSLHTSNFSFIVLPTSISRRVVVGCALSCVLLLRNAPGRWQWKMLFTINKCGSKIARNNGSIAICHKSGDKWQSKTLFLMIFDLHSLIVLTFSIATYPVWGRAHGIGQHDRRCLLGCSYYSERINMCRWSIESDQGLFASILEQIIYWYSKFGNFGENFIFAHSGKRRICGILRISWLWHNLPISVNHTVIFPFQEGFIFTKLRVCKVSRN